MADSVITRLARASPRILLVDVTLLQFYWLTGVAQFSPSPLEVAHAILGIVLTVYVLGHSFRVGFLGNFRFATVASVGRVAIDVILSVIIFTVTVCMLSFFFLLTTVYLGLIIGGIIIASNLLEMTRAPVKQDNSPLRVSWIVYPGVIIAFGLLVAFIFRYSFAWPSMPGWDTYVHLAETSLIQAHHGSSDLFPIASGTVLPYPLVFHAQMASFSDILGINAYTIFWLAPFYLIPIYGLLVYGLASVLTKDRMQSLFAGMLGASIGGGEVLLGPQYLFPSTLFILIFLLSLIAFIDFPLKGVSQSVFGFALFAVTFAIYYYPLLLATVPIVAFLIDHGANSRFAQWRKPALLGSVVISIVLTILGSLLLAGVTLPLGQLTSILRSAYPDALWLLIILGSLVVLRRFSQDRTGYSVQATMVLYVAMLIGLYFLPISSSWRSELMLRPFAAIVASYSLPLLSSSLSRASEVISRFEPDINRLLEKSDRLVKLSLVLFIAFSTSLVVQTYVSYAQHVPNWSNISSDEYQAAQWLSEKTPAGGYILTDPSTGMMLRGVALLNSSTSFIIGGHTPSPQRYAALRKVIYEFFTSQNGTEVPIYFSELPHTPDFIVITSRTASWASWGGVNSTFPAPTTNSPSSFPGFGKFNSSSFTMVSKWETVMIYRLTAV